MGETRDGLDWVFATHGINQRFFIPTRQQNGLLGRVAQIVQPALQRDFRREVFIGDSDFIRRQRAGRPRRGHAKISAERQMVDDRECRIGAGRCGPLRHPTADTYWSNSLTKTDASVHLTSGVSAEAGAAAVLTGAAAG